MGSFKQTFLIVYIIVISLYVGMSLYSASIVNDSLNRAKLSSAKSAALGYVKSVEFYCLKKQFKNEIISVVTTSDIDKLLIKGTQPTAINFNLNDNCLLTSGTVTVNGYKFTYEDEIFTQVK